jgi:amidohydrolase
MEEPDMHEDIVAAVDALAPRLAEIARAIHAHPELGYQERFAQDLLCGELERAGLAVERGVGGVATAFRARFGRPGGARVAVLAEYDALPEIGHACGHNLIGTGALGAALALARIADRLPGEVVVLGTPAEEGGGGKIRLLEAGAFAGLDAAMMFHPFDRTVLWQGALAMTRVEAIFHGTPAHAAAAPWAGSSALRAVIQTFNLVDSGRVHLRDGARVHGIITDGGQAVNIIPERAACAFSLRAPTAAYLERVIADFTRCAEAAAAATGTRLELHKGTSYKDMRNNEPLARRFGAHLGALGVPAAETDPTSGQGSTDMGDVSYAVPAIHPYLAICAPGEAFCHHHAFTAKAASEQGISVMLAAAKALALTAVDVLADDALRSAARRFFARGADAEIVP